MERGPGKKAVIVFLKAPEQGCVKTRLSRYLDESFVLDLYKGFIEDTLETLKTTGDIFIYFLPSGKQAPLKTWLGNGYAYFPQKGNDLGKRMSNAFQEVFTKGYTSVLLVGTDIPELSRDIIFLAYKTLQSAESVIGPTADGGYYLIGFQKSGFLEKVFHGIDWSTASVLDQTLEAINKRFLSHKLLPRLNDIDTPEDLTALAQRVAKGGKAGKRTLEFLKSYED